MRVFIQQVHTGKVLTQFLEWKENNEAAQVFVTSVAAIEFLLLHKIKDAQVVIRPEWEQGPSWEELVQKLILRPELQED